MTLKIGKFQSILVLTLCIQLLPVWAPLCPAPFSLETGQCLFVNTSQSFTWCEANRQCASMGGELLNTYSSLQSIVSSFNCSCELWFGLTDLSDERQASRSGWLRINGNGIMPFNDTVWLSNQPNDRQNQDCLVWKTEKHGFNDFKCSTSRGFACEYVAKDPLNQPSTALWIQTPFKRTSYNPSSKYCYTDLKQVDSAIECMAGAMNSGSSRHVLYNSKLRTCRLLLFTDSQVEEEVETSADWVKFRL